MGLSALPARIPAIDVARGVAIVMMTVYHFGFDLLMLGFWSVDVTRETGWVLLARVTVSSFLALVGVSLVLATRDGIRWRPLLIRLAQVGGAAALISLVTWYAIPDAWIFFGVLHMIALATVLGIVLRNLPWWALLASAPLVIAAPSLRWPALFDAEPLVFLGLSRLDVVSNDFVPVFPWLAPVLIGLAAGRVLLERASAPGWTLLTPRGRPARTLAFLGRHSLIVYLVHQPILIGLLLGWRWLVG